MRQTLGGTVLLALGGMLFVDLNKDPDVFIVLTVALTTPRPVLTHRRSGRPRDRRDPSVVVRTTTAKADISDGLRT